MQDISQFDSEDMVDTGIRTGPMTWDLAHDGDRFLIIAETPGDASSITVATNWRSPLMKGAAFGRRQDAWPPSQPVAQPHF